MTTAATMEEVNVTVSMAQSRMDLALRRWAVNLVLAQRRGYVRLLVVTIGSITGTVRPGEQGVRNVIVLPSVDSVRIVSERNDETVPCHRNESVTREKKERLCDFCFERYTYRDYRSRYCSDTCKQDAYQVRQAFKNGRAKTYYRQTGSYMVMEDENK